MGAAAGGAAPLVVAAAGGAAPLMGAAAGGAAPRVGAAAGGTAPQVGAAAGGAAPQVGAAAGGAAPLGGAAAGRAAPQVGAAAGGSAVPVGDSTSCWAGLPVDVEVATSGEAALPEEWRVSDGLSADSSPRCPADESSRVANGEDGRCGPLKSAGVTEPKRAEHSGCAEVGAVTGRAAPLVGATARGAAPPLGAAAGGRRKRGRPWYDARPWEWEQQVDSAFSIADTG